MKKVMVIHGGTTFAKYDDFLEDLRTKTVSIDRLTYRPFWKERLQETLGPKFQVLLPSMPNKSNARYEEWKLWFDRLTEVLSDGCILIGHSLGGIFLAKYLSENEFPHKIASTILIAAPFSDESVEDLTDFKLTGISDLFKEQAGRVVLFHGSDDPVVAPEEIKRYQKALPEARSHVVSAPDHFMRESFPELVSLIKEL